MSGQHQTSPGRITSIEAVAVRIVCEDPQLAHPSSTVDGSLNLTGIPIIEAPSYPEIAAPKGQVSKCIGTDQSGFRMGETLAGWSTEVKAPSRDEALSSLLPRDDAGRSIRFLTCMIIGALGLAWWIGLLDPYRFLNSDRASIPLHQAALSDKAPLAIDNQTTSVTPDNQVLTPAGGDLDSKRVGGEPTLHTDRRVVTPADTVPKTAQKPATKPAVVALPPEKKAPNRPKPVPDTRPTTIEGWTVRNVSGRTAVLQGPDGTRKVSVGEIVPGAGRIDAIVRWGNRWIVATSKGLITTD
jgi:hypothetical protein